MKIKKKEFLSLKQGSMSVIEYRDRFIQLLRYAPNEVAEDERKHEHFIEGLNGPLQYALVAHSFPSFQGLLDKTLAIEHKRVQLGDMKRKAITQGTLARIGGGHRLAQYTPQGIHRLVRLPPLAPWRNSQDRVQTPHATSVVRLGIMLMFARRGLLVPLFRT
jgi:hypothetical protein